MLDVRRRTTILYKRGLRQNITKEYKEDFLLLMSKLTVLYKHKSKTKKNKNACYEYD